MTRERIDVLYCILIQGSQRFYRQTRKSRSDHAPFIWNGFHPPRALTVQKYDLFFNCHGALWRAEEYSLYTEEPYQRGLNSKRGPSSSLLPLLRLTPWQKFLRHWSNSHKHWVVENNKKPAWIRHFIATWSSNSYVVPVVRSSISLVVVPYQPLNLNLKLSSAKLSYFKRHLTGFWCNNVSFGAEERRRWKERGPLLLFNHLWAKHSMKGGEGKEKRLRNDPLPSSLHPPPPPWKKKTQNYQKRNIIL